MTDYKIQLKDEYGNRQYPVTSTTLVVAPDGKTAEQRLFELADQDRILLTKVEDANTQLATLTADADTEGSVDNKIRRAVSWGRIDEL